MRGSAHLARGRRTRVTLAAFLLLTGGLTACSGGGKPKDTLNDFLSGWRSEDLNKVGFVTAAGAKISAADVVVQIQALTGELQGEPLVLTAQGDPKVTGDIAAAAIKLDWTLPGGMPWSYQTTVRLTKRDSDGWKVIWEPSIVNSELTTGDKLALRHVAAERAGILDGAGRPIVTKQPVVTVGVTPTKIKNLGALTKSLATQFKRIKADVDLKTLKARVDKAEQGDFKAQDTYLANARSTCFAVIKDGKRRLEL